MKSIEILSKPTDGQYNIADTWTASRRSTSYKAPWQQARVYESPLRWCAKMRIVKLDNENKDKILPHYANNRKSSTRTTATFRIASRIRMDESKLENLFLAIFFLFIILTKLVTTRTSRTSITRTPRHTMARSLLAGSPGRDHKR